MDALIKLLIGLAIGTVIVAAILSWDTITGWFTQNKDINSDYGMLIKQALDNGKYTVVAGVFNSNNELTASNKWEQASLNQDTLQKFGNSDKFVFKLAN